MKMHTIVLCMGLCLACSIAVCQDEIEGWEVSSGNWVKSDGAIAFDGQEKTGRLQATIKASDVCISGRFRIGRWMSSSGGRIWIYARHSYEKGDGFRIYILRYGQDGKVGLARHISGAEKQMDTKYLGDLRGKWTDFELKCRNDRVSGHIGRARVAFTDAEPLSGTGVVLKCMKAAVEFADVKITPTGGAAGAADAASEKVGKRGAADQDAGEAEDPLKGWTVSSGNWQHDEDAISCEGSGMLVSNVRARNVKVTGNIMVKRWNKEGASVAVIARRADPEEAKRRYYVFALHSRRGCQLYKFDGSKNVVFDMQRQGMEAPLQCIPFEVIVNGDRLSMRVGRDVHYVKMDKPSLTGDGICLRSTWADARFQDIKITPLGKSVDEIAKAADVDTPEPTTQPKTVPAVASKTLRISSPSARPNGSSTSKRTAASSPWSPWGWPIATW